MKNGLIDTRWLRGSTEKCPACGSRAVAFDANLTTAGYGPGLAVCRRCKAIWEAFDPAQIWDKSDPHCSFREPCNNCAFRPGSPEQADIEAWKMLLDKLKCGGSFYCHKGVPIEANAEHWFAYPHRVASVDLDGVKITTNIPIRTALRLCRGYLNAWPALRRAFERESKTGELDVIGIVGDPGP